MSASTVIVRNSFSQPTTTTSKTAPSANSRTSVDTENSSASAPRSFGRTAYSALRRFVRMEQAHQPQQQTNVLNSRAVSRSDLAKKKLEQIFYALKKEREESQIRRTELERKLASLSVNDEEKSKIRADHFAQEMAYLRSRRRPMSEADFETISIIGRGAFGEVILVRHRESSEYYAMKKLRKADMSRKEHVNHAWSERHVLVAADHPFVCNLCFAFQNNDFLYLVMEFLPGGDLMTLLIARETLTEEESRFYAAEMVVAIDTIHKLGFIHRDVKPDNLLIDKSGHIKLSDFGLCKSFNVDVEALPTTSHSAGAGDSRSHLTNLTMSERAAAWKKSARKQAFSTVGT